METFADLISSSVPVLVDIYAEWCAPCRGYGTCPKTIKRHTRGQLTDYQNKH